MNKNAVIDFFDGNQSEVARVLGVSRSYISAWSDVIPEKQAFRLERLTDGALQYDASLYSCQHKQTA